MAHNESAPMMVAEKLNQNVSASPAPKTASKRSVATSEGQWPASSSTPTSSRKKPFLEPGGGTPLSVASLNVSNLDHSGSSSSRYRNERSLTMRITRGIQTIAPQTANRYCTARIPKRTASVPVQTDSVFVLSSPPKKILLADATCQTAEPVLQEACVGTSQQVVQSSKHSVDGWCQTMPPPEDQSITVPTTSTPNHSTTEQSNANSESASSFKTGLSNLIQTYDCDDDKQTEDNRKKKKSKGKQTASDQQHLLQESFVKETSKTVATKLDKKMSTILERHLATYNRSMANNRIKFMQWMKSYHTRQRQLEAKAARSQMARRIIVVRKRAPPVVVPRPAVTEQSIQCELPIVLPPEPPKTAVTVGTQWTRQKQTVTNAKRKPAKTRSTGTQFSSKISTDPLPATGKTSSTSTTRKGPMRQTKLHSYAEGGKDRPQQQPRRQQQQRKCSPKLAVKEASPPVAPASKNPPAKKKPPPPPPPKRGADSKNTKQRKEPSPEIHIEETPSEPSDTEAVEKKHYPYRTQKLYPSQCSKSTETSFLTPTKVRDILPEPLDGMGGQQPRHMHCETMPPQPNQSQLLSPMDRMYVGRPEPPHFRTVERSNYGPFLVPLRTTGQEEAISPTPPNMIYVNRPECRMLVRSNVPSTSNNTTVRGTGLVREKYPEVSIISSQQLCSQIGLAVEKALKNKTIPPLESMYGKPFIEVFNGVDFAVEDNDTEEDKRVTDDSERRAGIVCSSANDDLGQQQANRPVPPPFRNDRSPSLSPIVYRDDDSEDDFL